MAIRPKAMQQARPVLRPEETTMVDAAEARTRSMKGKREAGSQDRSRAAAAKAGQPREPMIESRGHQEKTIRPDDRGGKPMAS